jgi:hypothetical protein
MSAVLRSYAGFCALVLTVGASADNISFDASCDQIWGTCCDCGVNMKCNNWSVASTPAPTCPSLPGASDDVTIMLPCTLPAGQTGTVGTLVQTTATFNLAGSLGVNTTASFGGPVNWTAGTISRAGGDTAVIQINNGLSISGSDGKFLGGNAGALNGAVELIINSTATWQGAGGIQTGPLPGGGLPAVFRTAAGATFDVQNDAGITGTSFGLGRLVIDGTLIKSGAAGVSNWNVSLENNGLAHVQSGEIRLAGSGFATGEFRVDSGARLTFAPAFGFELRKGVKFTGEGDAVLVDTGSGYGLRVLETVDLNRLRVENSGSIGPDANPGHLNITGTLELDGAEIWVPMTVKAGARLEQTGENESFVRDLTIEGEVEILAGGLSTRDRVIRVQPSGVVEIRDGAALKTAGLSNVPIENAGTIRKSAGAGTASVLADFFEKFNNNAGGLDFGESNPVTEGGAWQIDAGTTLRAPGSFGQLFELNSGVVRGGGTLVVNRLNNNGGTVSPGASPGTLTIAGSETPARPGNYLQGENGTLEIEIGGATPGVEHDVLAVAGTATLGGTLRVTLINGFVPADGQSFTVLTAGARSGEFASLDASSLPAGLSAAIVYDNANVRVQFSGEASNGNENSGGNANENAPGGSNGNDNGSNINENSSGGGGGGNNAPPGVGPCGPTALGLMSLWFASSVGRRRRAANAK